MRPRGPGNEDEIGEIGNLASINTAPPDQSHSYYTKQQLGNLLPLAEKLLAHVIFYKNSKI